MPRRPRRRATRTGGQSIIYDMVNGELTPNSYSELKIKGTKLPTNRSFRVLGVELTASSTYPAILQVQIMNQYSGVIATSGPHVVGANVTRIRVRNHDGQILPANLSGDTLLAKILCNCEYPLSERDRVHVIYSLKVKFRLGIEVFDTKCPTKLQCISMCEEDYDTCAEFDG